MRGGGGGREKVSQSGRLRHRAKTHRTLIPVLGTSGSKTSDGIGNENEGVSGRKETERRARAEQTPPSRMWGPSRSGAARKLAPILRRLIRAFIFKHKGRQLTVGNLE